MAIEQLKNLLSQLGQSIGLPDLAADDEGYCCLSFDEHIVVHIQITQEAAQGNMSAGIEMLMLFCEIAEIGADLDAAKQIHLRSKLLEANVFGIGTQGSTLGLNTQNNKVTLNYQEPIRNVDFQRFQQILERFVNTCEEWINRVGTLQNENPEGGSTDAGQNQTEDFSMGMMV
jgi:hypothetical protein